MLRAAESGRGRVVAVRTDGHGRIGLIFCAALIASGSGNCGNADLPVAKMQRDGFVGRFPRFFGVVCCFDFLIFHVNNPVPLSCRRQRLVHGQCGRIRREIVQLHGFRLRFSCHRAADIRGGKPSVKVKKDNGKNLAIVQNRSLAGFGATFLQHSVSRSASTLASAGILAAISLFG